MKNEDKNYCRECGSKLKLGSAPADKIKVWYPDSMGGCMYKLDNSFNEKTGERNEAETKTCPKWKSYPILGTNNHDKIIIYNSDIHYL